MGSDAMTFAEWLEFHLKHGTRAGDRPRKWGIGEFADALGVDKKTLFKWRKGERPMDIRALLRLFFVDSEDPQQLEMERAWQELSAAEARVAPANVPPSGLCLGRDQAIRALADRLATTPGASALVLGGPGFGKTTITKAVAADRVVVDAFAQRRWFVELEVATTADDALRAIAKAVGCTLPATVAEVTSRLHGARSLIVLDNCETPWWNEPRSFEDLIRALSAEPDLSLLASVRGDEAISAGDWAEQQWIAPLAEKASRAVFLRVAGRISEGDPGLNYFLNDRDGVLGGIPLALTLMAIAAGREGDLERLRVQWEKIGVELANRGEGRTGRIDSIVQSIAVSLASPSLRGDGRELFSVLGALPAGLFYEDGQAILGEAWPRALAQLRRVGLLTPSDRADLLPPIRDYARRFATLPQMPVEAATGAARWIGYFLSLAESIGGQINQSTGKTGRVRLAPELRNIGAAVDAALDGGDLATIGRALTGIGRLSHMIGTPIPAIHRVQIACHDASEHMSEALCWEIIGVQALETNQLEIANDAFRNALACSNAAEDWPGQGRAIERCGDVALSRANYEEAKRNFEEALGLFERTQRPLGIGNCTKKLGDVAFRTSDYPLALEQFTAAIPRFKAADDLLGQANCWRSIGSTMLQQEDFVGAAAATATAQGIYASMSDEFGAVTCMKTLGNIAYERGDLAEAEKVFEEALPIFRKVGARLGPPNCILHLAQIALARSQLVRAASGFLTAKAEYVTVYGFRGEGDCEWGLGQVALARDDNSGAGDAHEKALHFYERARYQRGIDLCRKSLRSLGRLPPDDSGHTA
jgi:tetratricopeptide (TPR) repeat protein